MNFVFGNNSSEEVTPVATNGADNNVGLAAPENVPVPVDDTNNDIAANQEALSFENIAAVIANVIANDETANEQVNNLSRRLEEEQLILNKSKKSAKTPTTSTSKMSLRKRMKTKNSKKAVANSSRKKKIKKSGKKLDMKVGKMSARRSPKKSVLRKTKKGKVMKLKKVKKVNLLNNLHRSSQRLRTLPTPNIIFIIYLTNCGVASLSPILKNSLCLVRTILLLESLVGRPT